MENKILTALLALLAEQKTLSFKEATDLTKSEVTIADLKKKLHDDKRIDDEGFTRAYATVLHLPYVNLREKAIPKEILGIVPESTAREHSLIPYEQTAMLLKVAMADPSDRQIVEFIHRKVDMPIEIALASETGIKEALSRYRESLESELEELVGNNGSFSTADLNKAAEDLPIIRIVDAILRQAILQRASDIHLEPTETSMVVRYRIDGLLADKLVLPKNAMNGLVARIKVLSGLKIDEHRLPQDGRFKISTEDYQFSFRVSILPVFDGEKVVMRLLDESGHGLTLEELGLGEKAITIMRRNINRPHGMILVTGPTGSGKTTTLYAAMRELNTPDVNISTIEDPIEYRMPRINQTQVKPAIGLTFANGLRALVRQDPDIIMVGEIRDQETASLAVNAALTGHLVLSTLHTNSASGAIPRLTDMKVEPFLLASTLNVVEAQRLVRQLCSRCHKEVPVTEKVLDGLKEIFDTDRLLEILKRDGGVKGSSWKDIHIYEPVGCSSCHGGYRGRVGIHEFLEVTPHVQDLIVAQATAQKIDELAKKEQEMITMFEDGFIKITEGKTSLEEVLRVAQE